jgi:hypothetical protein
MQIKFRVQQTFNFSSYSYVIVFNTNGNPSNASGSTPEALGTQQNFPNYRFAIVVTQGALGPTASAFVYQPLNGSSLPAFLVAPATSQQIQFNPNSNGIGTEFSVIFDRALASFYSATPTPGGTATPTTSPTTSPTSSASPTASPSAGPGAVGTIWFFNYFVVQGNVGQNNLIGNTTGYAILDSLGSNGPTDNSYTSPPIDITQDLGSNGSFYALTPANPPSDPAALITGGQILNTP